MEEKPNFNFEMPLSCRKESVVAIFVMFRMAQYDPQQESKQDPTVKAPTHKWISPSQTQSVQCASSNEKQSCPL
jgi:hypothetical protein